MNTARINRIKVRGFRAYGQSPQEMRLSGPIAVVWAPNSQGKTSLAEAFEFLLTGEISRRALLGSARDEFAEVLRNAHMSEDEYPYVDVELATPEGNTYTVTRTLLNDYGQAASNPSEKAYDLTRMTPGVPAFIKGLGRRKAFF